MRKTVFVLIFALFTISIARGKRTPMIENARLVHIDTIFVDGTDTAWTQIFWQPAGTYKTIMVEVNDTNTADLSSDSAAAQLTLWQVFDKGKDHSQVVVLPSRAHPDSASFANSTSDFVLSDSLDIADMLQTGLYDRTSEVNISLGDTLAPVYNDTLSTIATTQTGAFTYYDLRPDYSPGLLVRLVGRLTNAATATGSRWIIRWYQQTGQPVTTK